ncbi:MAG: hypothetical protein ACYSWO_29605 [Planctomycetota bacterium]|jgi:hypothetical protein
MIKPCPFCGSEPEYTEWVTFVYPPGCIALAQLKCPTCVNRNGHCEVKRTIEWQNQEIVDQIHTVWPNMQLKYGHCEHGRGWLTYGGDMDPVAKRAIQPILKRAVIALWNDRPLRRDWPGERTYDKDWVEKHIGKHIEKKRAWVNRRLGG